MFKAIAFGLAAGAGVQAWRAWPPLMPLSAEAMAVVFVVGLVCAYLAGRARRGGSAVAVAVAEASAVASSQQHVNVAVVVPGQGAAPTGVRVPSDAAPWMLGAQPVPELDVNMLDGIDLQDVGFEEQERIT